MASDLVQGPDGQWLLVGVRVVLEPAALVVVLLLRLERLVAAWEPLGGPFGCHSLGALGEWLGFDLPCLQR